MSRRVRSVYGRRLLGSRMLTVVLKEGMPTAEEARRRLSEALDEARGRGMAALKLVHGYGSSGAGGRV
ncbi:MAG: hypothetical protein DCC65_14690 [Planctomycetota bacterium]|nr:MAG: hypothetical protein DCC65_14690 [Planctomycetota bacterium]